MKKITSVLLGLLLIGSLAACNLSGSNNGKESTSPEQSVSSEENIPIPLPEEPSELEETAASEQERLVVMDAAMYRGMVDDIRQQDGQLHSFRLTQAQGTSFGPASVTVKTDENTRMSFDAGLLQQGDYIEVFYGRPLEQSAETEITALTLNHLGKAENVLFSGTFVVLTKDEKKEGSGRLLLTSLNTNDEWVFHYSEETQIYLNLDDLIAGDSLSILFSGASTRSIPPQAFALEIRRFAE
ncbi:hypothetical protein U6B65_04925 [Oscillospiraceae bacterium MB08-C2-2]|nr:hypothetical protein U6B65_04925 [Oscillospiraceae bacterium MB08-C2-2]